MFWHEWYVCVLLSCVGQSPVEPGSHADVPWLPEVSCQASAPLDTEHFPLWDAEVAPRNVDEWRVWREIWKQRWLSFLGPFPQLPADTRVRILRSVHHPTVWRDLVEYETERGVWTQAYVLRPAGPAIPRSRAGVVVFHPTTAETINPVAGLTGQEEQHHGFKLAQRGFVVICPRCFLWQDARDYREAVAKFQQRQPDARGMVKMLFDGMRAVDVLLQQPDVDPRRIGASGHSLGAKETLYLMAFDERVRAGVFSEGGLAVTASNWDAVWYLGPEIRQPACGLEHHQLVALIAPRPFLVLAGGRGGADNEESCRLIRAALPVYQLYTASARVGVWNHAAGHRVPPAAFERWTEWLQTYLP